MNTIITFFQSVGAQVVAYYLCKWLDSLMCKGSKHEQKDPIWSGNSGWGSFLRGNP